MNVWKNMRKRILVDLLNLSTPEIAGVGVFTRNLFRIWLNRDDLPYGVTCYAISSIQPQTLFGFSESANVRIKKVNVRRLPARLAYQHFVVPWILRRFDLYYNPAVGIPFLAKLVSPRTKLVVTIHDMIPFYFPRKYTFIRSILVRGLSKYAAKVAHQVVTVSQNSKKDIMHIAAVPSHKVCVVYNFLSPPYSESNTSDGKYFLCISTLEPGKNIENTIRGFGRFIRESGFHDHKFYWIGRIGWGMTEMDVKAWIREERVEDTFVWAGYVTEEEKRKWLENCTAIVYLSYYEGFGLPVLEGMTFNKPSVASNCSALPEVVGDTGILCDPHDPAAIAGAMKAIIEDRSSYMSRIPDQLKRFDPHVQVEVFEHLIQSLIHE